MRRRLPPLWGDEGSGTLMLTAAIGVTFVLGLGLQLLALRFLGTGEYSNFIFALGVGNIANAIAAAIQPVVAARTLRGESDFLPLPGMRRGWGAGALFAFAGTAFVLSWSVGAYVAFLALVQVPMHALIGVGCGRLQAQRRFAWLAIAIAAFAAGRIGLALPVVTLELPVEAFIAALPAGLAVTLAILILGGAYRGVSWKLIERRAAGPILAGYACWTLLAWLLNADAIFARLFLGPAEADRYGVAFTLGRQPLYAVAPLAMVLLPLVAASRPHELSARWGAVMLAGLGMTLAASLALAVLANPLVGTLTGTSASGHAALLGTYGAVGGVGALITLQLTFFAGSGRLPSPRTLLAAAPIPAVAAWAAPSALALAGLHLTLLIVIAGWLSARGWVAVRASRPGDGRAQPARNLPV